MHQKIELADPLGVNEIMRALPEINERESLDDLSALLSELLCRYDNLRLSNHIEACAAVRDIGFVMSSVRKLGVQPEKLNPGLRRCMLSLSKLTEMVPRDTVYHYSIWNPEGAYQRLFTQFDDEKSLIKSVRYSIIELECAIDYLVKAVQAGPSEQEFADYCNRAQSSLQNSIGTLAIAVKNVHPKIFSVNLRPYFDPIEIDGKSYIASGGGQIPMFVVDKMVWVDKGKSIHQDSYFKFINESAAYLPPFLRGVSEVNFSSLSLAGLLAEAKKKGTLADSKNEMAVKLLLRSIIAFRQAHAHYAAKSFTAENIGRYNTGSGGYEMSFVDQVLDLTKGALTGMESI